MGRKKYLTEEERKAAHREASRKWAEKNKEKLAEYHAEWYQNNKEKLAEYQSEWRLTNKEKYAEYQAEWRQNNKEKLAEYHAEYDTKYHSTPFGRASNLVSGYRQTDKKHNRGECTITPDWIVENVFSQPCHYCGKTDWHELGCDRIDNSLPHTPDNVVPCCWECNNKKQKIPYDEFMKLIGKIA